MISFFVSCVFIFSSVFPVNAEESVNLQEKTNVEFSDVNKGDIAVTENADPEVSIEPDSNSVPEENMISEENPVPEENSVPEEGTTESGTDIGENVVPEDNVTPEDNTLPENSVNPEENIESEEITEENNGSNESGETLPEEEKNEDESKVEEEALHTEADPSEEQEKKRAAKMEEVKAAGRQWEAEGNNSMSSADRIYPNASCYGYLSSYSDEDWFKFTIGSNGYISLTLNHEYIEHNGTYWNVCLYSQDGSEMYTMGVNGDITSQRSCRVGLPAGTYYVKVREGTFHSDVNYNLRVNYVAADFWEREDNDNRNASDSISANKSVTGSIMNYDDEDWYKFTIGSKGYISLTLNHEYIEHNGTYWNVYLYKQDGSEMYRMNVNGDITSQRSCRIGLPAGTYYIKVTRGTFHSNVNYNLRVNYVAAGYWETESNDSQSGADQIAPNVSVTGSLMNYAESDYYKFETKSSGYISITLNHSYIDSSSNYWKLRLYRALDGALLHEAYCQGNITSQKTCRIGLPAGKYLVQVTQGTFHSDMDYNLRINYVSDNSYETEKNDTIATADSITKNKVSRGTLMTNGDQDYYTFTLKSKCYVNFRLTHGYIDDDWDYFHLTVSNKSNSPIMEYSLSGTELGLNKGMVLPAGKYYVKVTSSNRHSTTPYGILVQPIIK